MSADWSESLFNSEKGDSLGDGSWGRPAASEEPALAPVAWDKLPKTDEKPKKARARLATPAPGSQKESGLLDIRAIAAGMAEQAKAESAVRARQPTPPPVDTPRPARLATQAKASAGSGLIDVNELVRLQQEEAKAAESGVQSVPEDSAASSSGLSSSSVSGLAAASASLSAAALANESTTAPAMNDLDDDVDLKPAGGASRLYLMVGVLAVAVVALGVFVVTQ